MEDIARITVRVPGQEALNEVLAAAQVNLDCGAPTRDTDGNYVLTLYASPSEAAKISALPYQVEVDEDYGRVLAARQEEVSKTDRFEGGTVKPEGLGVKR